MGESLVYIQIHFGDKKKNYVAPYETVDNDEDVLFTPHMFKDALNEWIHGRIENFVVIPIVELWNRLDIFRTKVLVPPYVVSKLENMIRYIERHEDEYAGISLVC
jgi:hypothetical protein